jgi:hypothetical protein
MGGQDRIKRIATLPQNRLRRPHGEFVSGCNNTFS